MFGTRHQATVTATINDQAVEVNPGETILEAALRDGIELPNLCRVGGCGTCKCRLLQGEVTEMTETGYLLTEEQIAAGYILACQSRPRSDVRIAAELAADVQGTRIDGHIVQKQMLTHDIAQIDVQLEDKIDYRAGQFAQLTLATLPQATRSYSFSSPPSDEKRVRFAVRRVPGGTFSTRIVDEDVVGEKLSVRGPGGDFWLRPGTEPVIMIAGGSGLAPIYAMLQEAWQRGESRPVTLLFGARQCRDLYYLEELRALEKTWPAFTFVPVLSNTDSEDECDKDWSGAHGLVTDFIDEHLHGATSAYLCGPPPMVDAAERRLIDKGIAAERIHADRFLTQNPTTETGFSGDVAVPRVDRPAANLGDYLKFGLFHLIGLFSALAILAGGANASFGFAAVLAFYVFGDALAGDDLRTPRFKHRMLLTAQLWLALPLLALIVFNAVWSFSPGDPLGYGAWLSGLSGYDLLEAKGQTTGPHALSVFLLTGLMIGMVGTIPAHELTHRTWDPVSMRIGRWLLAFSFDTAFSIEHVYGHHRYVSTARDPATAPRGRNVYHHILASTVEGNISAWKIERERLQRKKHCVFSHRNAYLRGQMMSVTLLVLAYLIGGPVGALYFLALAFFGKALLEVVNYMEHYGMVRLEDQPVQPRHSWNTNARLTSWSMFNLSRHSHHHAQGEIPYEDLLPMPDAPTMVGGYLSTLLLTLVPPVWHRLMTQKLIEWDEKYATPEELVLAQKQNAASGLAGLGIGSHST
ncbi:fatty acid desaturase [Biformimicrobium ophioploci]|uniref:Flavodoxin reductase n=1 Tax=Biformimicrobium ophioploci TaxID=3036711 RepID=A0ABQ6M0B9_9GAMM|nr:fatty acid desaturase [Microbulbifer sp. NKW57]GMG87790.1 hypothetical protein MNKW57_21110 [Microbulbifer sp. NKW57]